MWLQKIWLKRDCVRVALSVPKKDGLKYSKKMCSREDPKGVYQYESDYKQSGRNHSGVVWKIP